MTWTQGLPNPLKVLPRKQRRARPFLAVLAILLAAGHPSASGAATSGDVVRIGVLGDQSGMVSSIGGPGSVLAARLAVADAGGAVLGHPVEVLSGDHLNKADTAKAIALRWFGSEGVVAIADLNDTAATLGVVDAARAARRTTMISGATSENFTGAWCSPYNTMWSDDTWTLSHAVVDATMKAGGDTWFFIIMDANFGRSLRDSATERIVGVGGKVLGSSQFPLGTADFSANLVEAASSGAKVVAVGSAGTDTINALKQAGEFGLTRQQRVIPFLTFITDIDSVGLADAQGLVLLSSYYWNMDEPSRKFAQRFRGKMGRVPTKEQASVYASVSHYLKAVAAAGTFDADAVGAEMRRIPVDYFGRPGTIRADGRVIIDVGLFRVKAPSESKERWDDYEQIATVPANQAYHPPAAQPCRAAP